MPEISNFNNKIIQEVTKSDNGKPKLRKILKQNVVIDMQNQ